MENTKKIVIVDDDIDVLSIVETILKNEGYKVITAESKEEGLKKVREEKPNLVISDVMMSTHYEGFEFAAELTSNEEFNGVPVLMQTSINVFSSPDEDAMKFARNYRSEMNNHDLDVLLVENKKTGSAGIDYKNEKGEIIWLPISGFIAKPVKAQNLLEAVRKVIK